MQEENRNILLYSVFFWVAVVLWRVRNFNEKVAVLHRSVSGEICSLPQEEGIPLTITAYDKSPKDGDNASYRNRSHSQLIHKKENYF